MSAGSNEPDNRVILELVPYTFVWGVNLGCKLCHLVFVELADAVESGAEKSFGSQEFCSEGVGTRTCSDNGIGKNLGEVVLWPSHEQRRKKVAGRRGE